MNVGSYLANQPLSTFFLVANKKRASAPLPKTRVGRQKMTTGPCCCCRRQVGT